MKFQALGVSLLSLSAGLDSCTAFSANQKGRNLQSVTVRCTTEAPVAESLTEDVISKLQFREAQERLETMELDTSGTLSAMRERLRIATVYKDSEKYSEGEKVKEFDEEKLNAVSCSSSEDIFFRIDVSYLN